VVDSSDAEAFPREVARIASEQAEIRERGAAARRYAEDHFTQSGFAARFEQTLQAVAARQPEPAPALAG
jgi:glycosyltransferase involved in cell wall biosynthesis